MGTVPISLEGGSSFLAKYKHSIKLRVWDDLKYLLF